MQLSRFGRDPTGLATFQRLAQPRLHGSLSCGAVPVSHSLRKPFPWGLGLQSCSAAWSSPPCQDSPSPALGQTLGLAGMVGGIQEELSHPSALPRTPETLQEEKGSQSGSSQEGQEQLDPAGTSQWVHDSSAELQFINELINILTLAWLSQPRERLCWCHRTGQ